MTSAPGLAMDDIWELRLTGPRLRAVDLAAIAAILAGAAALTHVLVGAYNNGATGPLQPLTDLWVFLGPLVLIGYPIAAARLERLRRRHTRWLGGDIVSRFDGDRLRVERRWRWLAPVARIDLDATAELWMREAGDEVALHIVDDRGQHVLLGFVPSLEQAQRRAAEIVAEAHRRGAAWSARPVDDTTWRYGHLPEPPPGTHVEQTDRDLYLTLPGEAAADAEEREALDQRAVAAIVVSIMLGVILMIVAVSQAGSGLAYVLFAIGAAIPLGTIVFVIVQRYRRHPAGRTTASIHATAEQLRISGGYDRVDGEEKYACHPRWLAAIDGTGGHLTVEHHLRGTRALLADRTPAELAWVAARLRHYYRVPRQD